MAPTEKQLNPRIGQRLNLVGGNFLILRPGGVLEFINMNGLVARRFEEATIIEDGSGEVWILSGGQRVRAGKRLPTIPTKVTENFY